MIERSFAFGPDEGLIGTVCLPQHRHDVDAKIGVLLFNAGVVHRIGPHRINVRLARQLAESGIPSIRFDLAGQGDSARSHGNLGFEQQAVKDIQAAMDCLGNVANVSRFALFGFCSGGVHSYATAKIDERVAGLLMYDTYIYPTLKSKINRYLIKIRARGFVSSAFGWMQRRFLASLKRLRGEHGSDSKITTLSQAGAFVQPSEHEFAETVLRLHRLGMRIGVIYSGGFEQYNYRNQFVDAFKKYGLAEFVTSEFLREMDHSATLVAQQIAFTETIKKWCVDLNQSMSSTAIGTPSLDK
jgi:dienelactone hydrolase